MNRYIDKFITYLEVEKIFFSRLSARIVLLAVLFGAKVGHSSDGDPIFWLKRTCLLSQDIVEAEIVGHKEDQASLKVLTVYKGSIKVGSIFTLDLEGYRKKKKATSAAPAEEFDFQVGDQLIIDFYPPSSWTPYPVHKFIFEGYVFDVVPTGVDFMNSYPTRPYIADLAKPEMPVDEYRQLLREELIIRTDEERIESYVFFARVFDIPLSDEKNPTDSELKMLEKKAQEENIKLEPLPDKK